MFKRLRSLLVACVIGLSSSSAPAQWAVFDASNFVKNTLTAAQTYQQYAQQLLDYSMQANQYVTMVKNLERMPTAVLDTAVGREIVSQAGGNANDPDSWGGLQTGDLLNASKEVFNTYKTSARLMNEGARLYERAGTWGTDMNRFSSASGMSWEQIFKYEQERAKAGQDLGQWRYQQAQDMTRQLQGFQQRADQQLRAAGEAQGAVDALGNVAALNHTMTDQLSSLIAASARQEVREGERQTVEGQQKEEFLRMKEKSRRALGR